MPRKINKYLSDRVLITNLVAKLIITFGVVLIVGGLCLMVMDAARSTHVAQVSLTTQSAVSTFDWIPGVPFYIGDLANCGVTAVGLVSWILGMDLLLTGLGLWVRHRLAHFAALTIFVLAAFFQFVQFLLKGFIGSPVSVVELFADGAIVYFLFSRFDSVNNPSNII